MAELEGIRRALIGAITAAALSACGRTEGLLPPWNDETGGATMSAGSIAGRGGAPIESRAGAAGAAQSASGGRAFVNPTGGSAGSVLDGVAGFALGGSGSGGSGGSRHTVEACDRATTPILDGQLATQLEHEPATAVAGDWNRDGKLDLATGNTDGSVSVLLGNGDGSFTPSVTYTSGLESTQRSYQISIAASDLDGNGTLDLVTTPPGAGGLRVWLGAADGTFASPATYGPNGDFALGDFDGDGDPDIAVAGWSEAVWLRNHGDGSFGTEVTISTGDSHLNTIAAGDLNHDGRFDLVTRDDSELRVLLGNGDGSFVKTQVLEGSMYDHPVRIADINADGHPDLLFPDTCGPRSWVATTEVFLGRGDGTFSNGVSTYTEAGCGHSLIVDVNGDGAADVLRTSPLTVLLGSREGLLPPVRSSKAGGGTLLGTGDWNGDGKLDLATAAQEWLAVHFGNGDGTFGESPVYATTFNAGSLALADLDADGVLDVATTTIRPGERGPVASSLNVLRGAAEGTFLGHVDYPIPLWSQDLAAVDLDGDGLRDLVTSTYDSIAVRLGTGNTSFAPEVTWLAETEVVAFAVGDLNGDAHADIAVAIGSTSNLRLLFGTGDGTLAASGSVQLPARPVGIAVADVNGDAKQDLVVTLYESANVDVLLGNGDGTFAADQLYPTKGASGVTSADLNADANVDLVVWNNSWDSAGFSVFLGTGNGSFAPRLDYPAKPTELAAGDFNRDGRQDLVMIDDAGFEILLGAGDGTFTCRTRYVGDSMYGLGVGDLNRDGRIDVVTTTSVGVNVFLNPTP